MAGLDPYEKYVVSGSWKCGKSPIGAHHWMELVSGREGRKALFLCKYCFMAKWLPADFVAAMSWNTKHHRFPAYIPYPKKEVMPY